MPTLTIDLTNDQAELIDRLVEPGRFRNRSEVFGEGVLLLKTQEAEEATKLAALRAAIVM